MVSDSASSGPQALARIDARLLRTAAVGGLLGGLVMFFLVAGYNASAGMGFLTVANVCFAAWVFRGTAMMTAAEMPGKHMAGAMPSHSAMAGHGAMGQHGMGAAAMMNEQLNASHVIVGLLLHLGMSAVAGAAFAIVLAVLLRSGLRLLASPAGYVTAAVAGGALLYVIMIYGFAPLWNTDIVNFTPRVPFFISHLLFGALVGGWVYWKLARPRGSQTVQARRPGFGSAG